MPNKFFLGQYCNCITSATLNSVNVDETISNDLRTVKNYIFNYYNLLYKSEQSLSLDFNRESQDLKFPKPISHTESDQIIKNPSSEEIQSVLNSLPLPKFPGPNGIPYKAYKTFSQQSILIFKLLFKRIFSSHNIITGSNTCYTIMLYKKSLQYGLDNWRLIALTNLDSKIISKYTS